MVSLTPFTTARGAKKKLHKRIQGLVQSEDSLGEVHKMTAEVVKQAATWLKAHKMDMSQGFSSNALARRRPAVRPARTGVQELAAAWHSYQVCAGMCDHPADQGKQGPRPVR